MLLTRPTLLDVVALPVDDQLGSGSGSPTNPTWNRSTAPARRPGLARGVSIVVLTLGAACGPEPVEAPPPSSTELLAEACEAFCERALSCEPGEFAERWEFDDLPTCIDACNRLWDPSKGLPKEDCEVIRADLYNCGAAIPECVNFEALEDNAFSLGNGNGHPCTAELDEFRMKCF